MSPDEFVPIGQIPFNMADFGNALPVFRVVGPPERQRVNIEVLPVQVYALFGKQGVDVIHEPRPGFLVA